MSYATVVSILVTVLLFGSCIEREAPPFAVVRPNVGSTFTFSVAPLDSAGARVRRDSATIDDDSTTDSTGGGQWTSDDTVETITVVASGVQFAGKGDVTAFVQSRDASGDTTYVAYEENGDLALAMPNPFGGRRWIWATFPLSGRSSVDTLLRLDTVIREMPLRIELVSSYGGMEQMSAAGRVFEVRRGNVSFRVAYTTPAGAMQGGIEQIIWFAPSIGFLVRKEERGIGIDADGAEQGMVMSLMNYHLR